MDLNELAAILWRDRDGFAALGAAESKDLETITTQLQWSRLERDLAVTALVGIMPSREHSSIADCIALDPDGIWAEILTDHRLALQELLDALAVRESAAAPSENEPIEKIHALCEGMREFLN